MNVRTLTRQYKVWWLPLARYEYHVTLSSQEILNNVRVAVNLGAHLRGRLSSDRFYVYYVPRLSRDGYYNGLFAVYFGKVWSCKSGCDLRLVIRPNLLGCVLWWLIFCFTLAWVCGAVLIVPVQDLAAVIAMGLVAPMQLILFSFAFWHFERRERERILKAILGNAACISRAAHAGSEGRVSRGKQVDQPREN